MDEPISEDSVRHIIKQLLEALQYLHSNLFIVHRDLKPSNILCLSEQTFDIKLIDFGFSTSFKANNLNQSVGSPKYMAPELIKSETYNEKVDIWALGLVTYELICGGEYPFSSNAIELKE